MGLTLIHGIGQLLTLQGAWTKSGRHIQTEDLGLLSKAAILLQGDRILWVGSERNLKLALKTLEIKATKIKKDYDARGATVLPGWIDCHTHSVFAGNRWSEFEMRCRGASYQEIAQAGGGILSTMKATRKIAKKELAAITQERVHRFLKQGVTTLEIKSGYALNLKDELKQLEVARSMEGPRIVTTFLGAHAKPPEFERGVDYLKFLVETLLPKIQKKKLADRVDIFVEKNFFEASEAKFYLEKAKELGFSLVIHADQLTLSGGTGLAVELGALSADHVIQLGSKEIKSLAQSSTTAVLLPLADLYMKCPYPPARKLIDAGARVALATDYNPGSCPSQDIQLVGLLGRLQMAMTLPEIISALTVGGAFALGMSELGCLMPGFRADLQWVDTEWQGLFYQAGHNPTTTVFVGGRPAL